MATNTSSGTHTGRRGIRPQSRMRNNMAHPAALTATDINPVMLVGAPSYASGAHWWKGTAAILNNTPVIVVTNATTAIGLYWLLSQIFASAPVITSRFVLPVST